MQADMYGVRMSLEKAQWSSICQVFIKLIVFQNIY